MPKKYYAVRKGRKTGIFTDSWDIVRKYVDKFPKAEYKGFQDLKSAEKYMGYSLSKSKQKENKDNKSELPKDKIVSKSVDINNIDSLLVDDFDLGKIHTINLPQSKNTKPKSTKSNKITNKEFTWDEESFDYSGLVIFTDGSVEYANGSSNKGFGVTGTSFGIVVLENGTITKLGSKSFNDSLNDKRNVIGEIRGVLSALKYANKIGAKSVKICFDYIGVALWVGDFHGVSQWKSKQPMTEEYVKAFNQLTKNLKVEFVKVPAHSNVKYNELADKLAKEAFNGDKYLNKMKKKYNIKD